MTERVTQILRNGGKVRRGRRSGRVISVGLFLRNVAPATMREISRLAFLRTLDLGATPLTDEMLATIQPLSRLTSLNLQDTLVSGRSIEIIAYRFANVRDLSLMRTNVSHLGLEYLPMLRGLESLTLGGSLINDRGMAHVGKVRGLRALHLMDTGISDRGLAHVERMERLEAIYLDRTRITDAGLRFLKNKPILKEVWLNATRITDVGVKCLAKLPTLEELWLSGTMTSDVGLRSLRSATSLKQIVLGNKMTHAELRRLQKKLPNLSQDLWNT